jgi:glucose dehydrogenase
MHRSSRTRGQSLFRLAIWLLVPLGVACARAVAPSAGPASQAAVVPHLAEPAAGEWRTHHGDLAGTRYSPLAQIDAVTVARLGVAWEWASEPVLGADREFRNQSTPLMVDGVLYFTAGRDRAVIAADAATGATLWVWRMDEGRRARSAPRANSGRGVAWWSDGDDARILVVTPSFRLVALDARTGVPVRDFGTDGMVDLKLELGVELDVEETVIGSSSPALVFGDVVMIGPALAIGLRPPSRTNIPGRIMAFDARTGALRWRFNTIPTAGQAGVETWEEESWRYTGNAGAWAPLSLDADRGWLYVPVEAATGDYYGGHRPGDNLYSTSLVCLDALTGERIWHQQIVRHDIWDYDNPTAPILADLVVDGRRVEAVVQLTKQSFAYVFDRVSGEPVWPMEERAVPASDVPGERASLTQPFPTRPAAYDRQGVSMDDLIDFTPALRAAAVEAIKPFRLGPLFTPASLRDAADGTRGTLSLPGTLGGTNWEHGAFDPATGMLYVGSYTSPSVLALAPDPERSDMEYVMVGGRVPTVEGLPLIKPPYSRITAIDLNSGDHAWMVAAGDTPDEIRMHPALAELDIPATGSSARPVMLATATLLFTGEGYGGQPYLRALDKRTGAEIRRITLPAAMTSSPMSYELNGRQYLAFWVGDPRGEVRSRLMVLALPD